MAQRYYIKIYLGETLGDAMRRQENMAGSNDGSEALANAEIFVEEYDENAPEPKPE